MSKYYEYFASGVEGRLNVLEGSCTRCIWGTHKLGIGNFHRISPFNWQVCRDCLSDSGLIVDPICNPTIWWKQFAGMRPYLPYRKLFLRGFYASCLRHLSGVEICTPSFTKYQDVIWVQKKYLGAAGPGFLIHYVAWSTPKKPPEVFTVASEFISFGSRSQHKTGILFSFSSWWQLGRMWSQGLSFGLPVCQAMTDLLENEAPKILEKSQRTLWSIESIFWICFFASFP